MDVEIWGTVQKLKKKGKIFRRNETQPYLVLFISRLLSLDSLSTLSLLLIAFNQLLNSLKNALYSDERPCSRDEVCVSRF